MVRTNQKKNETFVFNDVVHSMPYPFNCDNVLKSLGFDKIIDL